MFLETLTKLDSNALLQVLKQEMGENGDESNGGGTGASSKSQQSSELMDVQENTPSGSSSDMLDDMVPSNGGHIKTETEVKDKEGIIVAAPEKEVKQKPHPFSVSVLTSMTVIPSK
jgi:hypothetical protein